MTARVSTRRSLLRPFVIAGVVLILLAAALACQPRSNGSLARTADTALGARKVAVHKIAVHAGGRAGVAALAGTLPKEARALGANEVVATLDPRSTASFSMVGVTWESGLVAGHTYVEVRWRTKGSWSPWTQLDIDPDLASIGTPSTEPLWVGRGATAVAARVIATDGSHPKGVRVVTIDPGKSDALRPLAQPLTGPPIIYRSAWGAKPAGDCDEPVYAASAKGAVMHHTVGSNTYAASDSASIVRGIQAYHMDAKDWCDIGYNFLVDKYGQIFEGREGGTTMPVRAAHSNNRTVNMEAMGVSLMGTFTSAASVPSAAMQEAAVQLVAWRFADWGIPAYGTYRSGGITLNRIAGHRDVTPTECPGNGVYNWLGAPGGMRDRVAWVLNQNASDRLPAPTGLALTSKSSSSLTYGWQPVPGATNYMATYYSAGWPEPKTQLVTATTLKISQLGFNKRLYLSVRPADAGSNLLGPSSPTVAGVTGPSAASRFLHTDIATTSSLRWRWQGSAKAVKWDIRISSSYKFSRFKHAVVRNPVHTFKPLAANTTYYAQVRALSKSGKALSKWLPAVTSRTLAPENTAGAAGSAAVRRLSTSAGELTLAATVTDDQATTDGITSFRIQGHGYGHGIGMSQNGAAGGAKAGALYPDILAHYYPGAALAPAAGKMRVWITADTDNELTVKAKKGITFRVLSTGKTTKLWVSKKGATAFSWYTRPLRTDPAKSALFVSTNKGSRVVLKYAGDAQFENPYGLRLLIGGKWLGYRSYLRSVRPPGSSGRRTINVLGLDNYVKGVVPREMPASWPAEALKAQAVAARTYGVADRNPADKWDICDTTACQVYGGMDAEDARTTDAVKGTAGSILTADGTPIFAQFSASSGGWTAQGSKPYLQAVQDDWDVNGGANLNSTWGTSLPVATVKSKIGWPDLASIRFTNRNGFGDWGGRVGTVVLTRADGTTKSMTGPAFRSMFGLKSAWLRFF